MIVETLLTIVILQVGLSVGLLFGFVVAVNPGLGKLEEEEYYKAMKNINKKILNPVFFSVYILPVITMPILTFLMKDSLVFELTLIATVLYIFGVIGITITRNVPLNERLEKLQKDKYEGVLKWYQKPWNKWHNIRTTIGIISFIILIFIAIII